MKRARFLAAACAFAACGCTLFESERARERGVDESRLEVVDDRGPFDPSEAVSDAHSAGEAIAQAGPGAPAEEVTEPERVRRRERRDRAAVERANRVDDGEAAKQAVAENPEAMDPGPAEPASSATRDLILECFLVVVLAGLLTRAVVAVHRHPLLWGVALSAAVLTLCLFVV